MTAIAAVIATALVTVVHGSLLEWFVHRVAFHRWFAPVHAGHHAEYRGARFQQPGRYRNLQPWWLELVAIGLHAPLFALAGARFGLAVGVTAAVVLALYAAASNLAHTAIHRPHARWLERTAWYRRLVARHREHHADGRVNFTILTPIADRILRSFRDGTPSPGRTAMRAR